VGENKMPLLLIRTTRPFAAIWPEITLGSPPKIRLTAIDIELGCKNWTVSPVPTLNVFQSMITDGVPCRMLN